TSECGNQEWIFAFALRHSTPTRIAGKVYHRRKGPANAGSRSFAGGNTGGAFGELRIPGRGNAEWNRKLRAETMNYVEAEEDRNVKAGLFYSDMLKSVSFLCRDDIKEAADLAFG